MLDTGTNFVERTVERMEEWGGAQGTIYAG